MDTSSLFSFLEDTLHSPAFTTNDDVAESNSQDDPSMPLKRKVNDTDGPAQTELAMSLSQPDEEPPPKKIRYVESNPVVLDSIDIEAKREVVSTVDLTGGGDSSSIELKHKVRHRVAIPPRYSYVPIAEHVPATRSAREYKFVLDPFQQVSIHAIERNESVLVSAHTSAGKTVVAEYAIAQCLQRNQRVIYTSPIKALSNQKYRELLAEFGDVGLLTGDVTINPSATCLVMTTEILRSMLYRGSEVIREASWVIYDEIHYMRDAVRGVVWEESIILLPHTVRYVFLSATIPNAVQFAEWICQLHDQPCHVVYTDFRPTPLQHYLFPAGGDGIYLVLNERGEFREDNFVKAMGMLQDTEGDYSAARKTDSARKSKESKNGKKKAPTDIQKIIKMIMLKNYNPVIVFAFSKRECEALALNMVEIKFTSSDEEQTISTIFANATSTLSLDDRQLPQIVDFLPMLKRGIGIHHGGLFPLLKEVIEILFQEGLLKVLFATETFSIGLNMPAKTVVFTATRKFDGHEFRSLSSGEYIQMSGRAGRRGLDERGVVIMMCDEKMEPSIAKEMITGEADPLNSAFHLSHNMILNLLRVEGMSPEYMLDRCFLRFQSSAKVPDMQHELEREEREIAAVAIPDEQLISEYYNYRQQLNQMRADFRETITRPAYILPFLQPGRLVRVGHVDRDFGWGVIISFREMLSSKGGSMSTVNVAADRRQFVVDVMLQCASGTQLPKHGASMDATPSGVFPSRTGQRGEPMVVPITLSAIQEMSYLRIHLPKDIRSLVAREMVWNCVLEVHRRFPDRIPLLDPILNMGITNDEFKVLVEKIGVLEHMLTSSPMYNDPRLPELYSAYVKKQETQLRIKELKKSIQAARDIIQMEELKGRKRVLRRLGFITAMDTVELKGRVACEISTGDELLLTELLFGGVFNSLSPEQCAGLLSCFVVTEKSDRVLTLTQDLAEPLRTMQAYARHIAQVLQESKVQIIEDEYIQSFKVDFTDVIMHWCKGASFREIFKIAGLFEGSLIRIFRRLQELIRQMLQAAKIVGSEELQIKFERASEMLERPHSIIFCSSLYL